MVCSSALEQLCRRTIHGSPDDTACRPRALNRRKGVCLLRRRSLHLSASLLRYGEVTSSKQDPAGPGSEGAANFTVTGPQLERGEPSVV